MYTTYSVVSNNITNNASNHPNHLQNNADKNTILSDYDMYHVAKSTTDYQTVPSSSLDDFLLLNAQPNPNPNPTHQDHNHHIHQGYGHHSTVNIPSLNTNSVSSTLADSNANSNTNTNTNDNNNNDCTNRNHHHHQQHNLSNPPTNEQRHLVIINSNSNKSTYVQDDPTAGTITTNTTNDSHEDDEDVDCKDLVLFVPTSENPLGADGIHPRKKTMKKQRKQKTSVGAVSGMVVGGLTLGPVGIVLGGTAGAIATNRICKVRERRAQRKYEQRNFQHAAESSIVVIQHATFV